MNTNNRNGINKKRDYIYKMVVTAMLTAIVILLQLFGSGIKIGAVPVSLVLVPIVLGGILLGPVAGAFLGFVFGAVTLIAGISGTDLFTNILFSAHPVITSCLCIGKATLAGLGSAFVYKLFSRFGKTSAAFIAGAAAPIINTGIFIAGALLMSGTINSNFVSADSSIMYFLFIGCAGINFLIELAINLIFAPALSSLSRVFTKVRG